MDENLHKDNLERFFKKAFDDLEQEKNAQSNKSNWDLPSDKVWDGIEPAIAGTSAIFSISWIKVAGIAATVALLICTALLLQQNNTLSDQLVEKDIQLDQLQKELKQQKNNSDNIDTGKSSIPNSKTELHTNNHPTVTSERRANSIEETSNKELENTAETIDETRITKTSNQKYESSIPPVEDIVPTIAIIDSSNSTKLSMTKEEAKNPPIVIEDQMKPIDRLALEIKPLAEKERNLGIYMSLADLSKALKPKLTYPAYVRVFTSYNYTDKSTKVKGSLLPPGPFRNIDDADGSRELGIRVGKKLNERWKVESGISFYSINHKTNLPVRIDFDRDREMPNPINSDEQQSVYSLTIPTAYGNTELEVELNRDNDQINPPDRINTNLKSKRKLDFTSIPVFIAYNLKEGKVNAYLKGGIAVNRLNNPDLISDIEAITDGFRAKVRNVNKDFGQLKKTSLDYIVGMELAYHFSQRVSLNVEPSYRRNIKPIFETPLFSTKSYAMGLQAGVNVHF